MTTEVLGYRDINSLLAGLGEILGFVGGICRVAEPIKPFVHKTIFKNSVAV